MNANDPDVVDATFVDESIPGEPAPAPGAELERVESLDPRTGELVDLRELDLSDVGELLLSLDHFLERAAEFRRTVVAEGARRLDRLNARKELVGELELETNAPTSISYREDVLRAKLEELVTADVIDHATLDRIFPTPPPPPPPAPKLNRTELNKLKRNPDAAGAIAAASVTTNANRTLKVKRKERPNA